METMNFEIYTKDHVDKQIADILSGIEKSDAPEMIITKISQILGNRMLLVDEFKPSDEVKRIFRVTDLYDGFDPDVPSCYSHPPAGEKCVKGRANLAGVPVFYGSIDPLTAVREKKEKIKPGMTFYVSKWELNLTEGLQAHTLYLNSATENPENVLYPLAQHQKEKLRAAFKSKLPENFDEGFFAGFKAMGDLFTSTSHQDYHISSAYGNFILYKAREQKPRAVIPIIIYPTVENNSSSLNYAIHPSLIEERVLNLKYVYKVKMDENLSGSVNGSNLVHIIERGEVNKAGEIIWQVLRDEVKADFNSLTILTYNGCILIGKEILTKTLKGSGETVQEFVKKELLNPEFQDIMNKGFAENNKFHPFWYDGYKLRGEFPILFPHGNEIETPEGTSCINAIRIGIEWQMIYRKKTI